MTDFSKVDEEFEKAVDLRMELNQVHWKQYKDLSTVFESMFGSKDLKYVSDMNYYGGGYPKEDSPARIDAMMWRVGKLARFWDAVGRLDEINGPLESFGFKIVPVEKTVLAMAQPDLDEKKVAKAVHRLAEQRAFKSNLPATEMFEWFLGETKDLQGVICALADEIKIDLYEEVERKLHGDVDKAGFTGTVNVVAAKRVKEAQAKDVGGIVEKALAKGDQAINNGEFLRAKVVEKEKAE